jgi:pyruvate formate lyase activating enzyme
MLREWLENHTMPAAPELAARDGDVVCCRACGNRCRIGEGGSGRCKVRWNRGGALRVPGGYVAGLQADPIEKKPFFHVLPGAKALSFGMLGCDLHCPFCQNWISSQALQDDDAGSLPLPVQPAQVVDLATEQGAPVVVSTYNEPLITSEWAAEIFRLASARGMLCGYVSNGNATPEVLAYLRPFTRLYKVDLKSFDAERYRTLGCELQNVLDTIPLLLEMGYWVEVVTLVIPGFNDSDAELRAIARFLAGVSPDLPWHVTAYHPDYRDTAGCRTTARDLDRAWESGREAGLRYVYAGNLPGSVGEREDTLCPGCNKTLIHRRGFRVIENRLQKGACPGCGHAIPGIWEIPGA